MTAGTSGILSWVLIIGVFYVFLIMPERKKQKSMKVMLSSVKAGDKIVTKGGIFGTIFSIDEERMVIITGPDSTRIEMSKLSIASVLESMQDSEVEEISDKTEVVEETKELTEIEENSGEKTE